MCNNQKMLNHNSLYSFAFLIKNTDYVSSTTYDNHTLACMPPTMVYDHVLIINC